MNALSLSPDVNSWLTKSRHPSILHVFKSACNLINERREVLAVVTQQIGNGPFNLVMKEVVSFSDHLNTQSPISIRANQLTLEDLIISTEDAKLWSPRPDWEMLHAKRDAIAKLLLTKYQKYGLDMGFAKNAQPYSTTTFIPNLPITNYQFSNSLISSLANADLPPSLAATQQLAGLGIGLTPAGDDFTLGAVLAAWIIHPPEVARVLAEEITNIAAPLTTSLSAAWLRSAGKGEAGNLWHNFFDALISNDPMRIQGAMEKILAVGATSGADALAGFIGTFTSYAKSETK